MPIGPALCVEWALPARQLALPERRQSKVLRADPQASSRKVKRGFYRGSGG